MRAAVLLGFLALAPTGCSDGGGATCGASFDAGIATITDTTGGTMFEFSDFVASHARDCGTESTTIVGIQSAPIEDVLQGVTFCIVEGDEVSTDPIDVSDPDAVAHDQFYFGASDGAGCVWTRDFSAAPAGSLTLTGYCFEEGAAFELTFDVEVPATRMCDGELDAPTTMALDGTVTVDFPVL